MFRDIRAFSAVMIIALAMACGGGNAGGGNASGSNGVSVPKQPSFTISNLTISPSLFTQTGQALADVSVDVSPSVGPIKGMRLLSGNGYIGSSFGTIYGPDVNTIVCRLQVNNASVGVFTNEIQLETTTGNVSNVLSKKITVVAFLPNLNSITPASATAGSAGFTLIATGTGFSPDSVVMWNSSFSPPAYPLKTTYVSATELQAQVPASALMTSEVVGVFVSTPDVWWTSSQSFTINKP
ncbi:hypothetical protein [Geothrix oryzisoli]|uniref:hypothetical protein n=1 Tax=Geothrix oryzisoli TaxID=2922721 RepID=UPI001FAC31B8|nr:hypothetical protein [Geothrix oryzisoli]